jgi:hypothetical protein
MTKTVAESANLGVRVRAGKKVPEVLQIVASCGQWRGNGNHVLAFLSLHGIYTLTMRRIFGIGVVAVLLCGETAISAGTSSAENLTALQIYETTLENYASMASYGDQGQVVSTMDEMVITTRFTTRLARSGLYRVEWEQYNNPPYSSDNATIQGVWSSGSSDYAQIGWGVQRQANRDVALSRLATSPNGAMVAIPRIFFDGRANGQSDKVIGLDRLADSKVGNIDCFQLIGESESGEAKTFWIGKVDFLIHQIRIDVSTNVMLAAWHTTTRGKLKPTANLHGFYSIETYTNIVVDKPYSPPDFMPSFPLIEPSAY